MNIILHDPETPKEKKELKRRIAEIHAECVIRYLEGLDCSYEQKKQLIEHIKKQGVSQK